MSLFSNRRGRLGAAFRNKNLILPNTITILGLLCGLYAIILSFNGRFVLAAYALILAALFDGLDGKVARLVKGTSEFGVQLDSLCDLVSFGVAPAILVYSWVLAPFGRVGLMAVFLFVACGALRLARFNVQAGKVSNVYFVGLPIPAAAAFIASGVLFVNALGLNLDRTLLSVFFVVSIYVLAFLMVSTVPFYSFKKINYIKEKPFNSLVILVLLIFVIGMYFEILFFLLVFGYIAAGLLLFLLRLKRRKPQAEAGKTEKDEAAEK